MRLIICNHQSIKVINIFNYFQQDVNRVCTYGLLGGFTPSYYVVIEI